MPLIVPIAVGDILQVRMQTFLVNQIGINCFNFWVTSVNATTPPSLQTFSFMFNSTVNTLYKLCLCSPSSFLGHSIRRIYPTVTLPYLDNTDAGFGTGDVNPLPLQTAGIITWRTDYPRGSYRGRSYIPFPSETENNSSGHPASLYVSKLQALGIALTTAFNDHTGNQMQLVVWSRKLTTASGLVTSFTPNQKWSVQRRRGDYGRVNPNQLQ